MGVILDTSIWVDVERGRLAPADVATVTGEEPVYLAPPVIAELQYGVHRAPNAATRNRRASALARIRRKLRDEAAEPRYIRTVHWVGYTFREASE